jgi:hypothetical protein
MLTVRLNAAVYAGEGEEVLYRGTAVLFLQPRPAGDETAARQAHARSELPYPPVGALVDRCTSPLVDPPSIQDS